MSKKWKTSHGNAIDLNGMAESGMLFDTYCIVWDDDSGYDVCYVVPKGDDNGNYNARLIAASPELFELCQRLIAGDDVKAEIRAVIKQIES